MNPAVVKTVVKVGGKLLKGAKDNKEKTAEKAKKEQEDIFEKLEENAKEVFEDDELTEDEFQKQLDEDYDNMKKRGEK